MRVISYKCSVSLALSTAVCVCAAVTPALPQGTAESLCVVDVPFSEPVPVAISQVYAAPDTVREVGNRSAPLVYGLGKLPPDSKGRYQTKQIFWPLSDGPPSFGSAYDLGAAIEFDAGNFAVNGQGSIAAIIREYQGAVESQTGADGQVRIRKSLLYASEAGGKFTLRPLSEGQLEEPSSVRWDAPTGRFILDALRWETSKSSGADSPKSVHYALSNGQLTAIAIKDEPRPEFTLPLGGEGESLELSHGTLAYRSAQGVQSAIADRLLESFDFGGWVGLFPIGEPGWYLAAATDTATAFELDMSSSPPQVKRKIMYRHGQGFVGEIVSWIFGLDDNLERDHMVDKVVADYPEIAESDCFQFSQSVNRLFRCDGKKHVRDAVVTSGSGPISGDFRYKGEASSISTAILISSGGAVRSQTASGSQDLNMKLAARPYSLFDFPKLKRSFIADSGSVYEIVSDGKDAKAVRIGFGQKGDWFFVNALPIEKSSEPVFFTRTGIFRIVDGSLQPFWKPLYGQIMITGGAGPTAVGKWQGIMFAEGDGFKISGFKLLTENAGYCAAKR
jgi:hypothetical protein